ncbi:response regulator transcription factor [Chloroflexota bacterium]
MADEKILVVDDEAALVDLIKEWLDDEGYRVFTACDGSSGLKEFFKHQPDLAILDVVMPGLDGFELCQRIREVSEIPVIILSVKGQEMGKVRGLRLGADDYLVKPIGRREFIARVAAVMRRARMSSGEVAPVYSDEVVTIDFNRHECYVHGEEVSLTPTEYRLLSFFVQNPNQVLTHQQLWDRIWGWEHGSLDSVKWHIAYLRKKIEEDPEKPQLILTVRGVGYRYQRLQP